MMKIHILSHGIPSAFLLVCANHSVHAQSVTDIVKKFEKRSHTFESTALPYRLFIPENYDSTRSYPLMLCLHGAGERGTDNENQIKVHGMATSWADTLAQSQRPCFVVAPQCPLNNQWVDVGWGQCTYRTDIIPISNELQTVMDLMDSLSKEFNIDQNRQYVTGLSMGGYGTWDLIARYPERFAAAVPMSGAGDTSKVQQFQSVGVWNFHGALDNVVPPRGSREMTEAMEHAGLEVVQTQGMPDSVLDQHLADKAKFLYTEYPDGYHVIWQESYDNPRLPQWVFSQTRSADVGVDNKTNFVEKSFELEQNYPNPFNPSTTICYSLEESSVIKLKIFNQMGQLIKVLVDEKMEAGDYTAFWDGTDHHGNPVTNGVYFYEIETNTYKSTKKMVFIK
jgi:predicted peptidase